MFKLLLSTSWESFYKMLEKHPLGSQAFYPIEDKRWLVVVASAPEPESVCAFWASGRQGVNYHQNVWHHPLLVIESQQFVIIDRGGDGHNCDEVELVTSVLIQQPKF